MLKISVEQINNIRFYLFSQLFIILEIRFSYIHKVYMFFYVKLFVFIFIMLNDRVSFNILVSSKHDLKDSNIQDDVLKEHMNQFKYNEYFQTSSFILM
jgi:hypothetical protein